MKTKIFIADINNTINTMFSGAELVYPQAHKDTTKSGCFTTWITEGSKFIAIGKGDETKDELVTFNNWKSAAAYAKTLTGEYVIGIRPEGKKQFNIVAKVS